MDILRPEMNLAIWDRRMPASLNRYLSRLASQAPFSVVVEDRIDRALQVLADRIPAGVVPDFMIDIRLLASAFATIAYTGGIVRVRLEAVTDQTCPRWHADAVGFRLLCTYRGSGTEWLPMAGGAAVARRLDSAALPCPPLRLATGAVAILKGEKHPDGEGSGCIHRSPAAGQARLLLCLDEPDQFPSDT